MGCIYYFYFLVTIPAMYTAMTSVVLNLVLAVVLTSVFEALGARRGEDQTAPTDYDERPALAGSAESGREALS
ncbi:MAG: hypothetical protein IMW89_15400 [Ktedonobacteraceae bacterium]|nr:hypothetical protein [Ktedonobacteraceae bacterium]